MARLYEFDRKSLTLTEVTQPNNDSENPMIIFGTFINIIRTLVVDRILTYVKVVGNSMVPTLIDGDVCDIEEITEETNIANGSVVVYINDDDSMVVHRIVKNNRKELITKGDNCHDTDKPVSRLQLVGLVKTKHISLQSWKRRIRFFLRYLSRRQLHTAQQIIKNGGKYVV